MADEIFFDEIIVFPEYFYCDLRKTHVPSNVKPIEIVKNMHREAKNNVIFASG